LTGNTKVLHLWLTQRLVFSCQRAFASREATRAMRITFDSHCDISIWPAARARRVSLEFWWR
jgi:hypothetical protein